MKKNENETISTYFSLLSFQNWFGADPIKLFVARLDSLLPGLGSEPGIFFSRFITELQWLPPLVDLFVNTLKRFEV
jgi:hypothetical protein